MEFLLIIGALCIIVGALLFPFHKKVGAEKFHAFAFVILGIILVIVPFATGMASFSDMNIPIANLAMVFLFLLLIAAITCMIWFFKTGNQKKGFISLAATAVIAIGLFVTVFAFSPKYNTEKEVVIAAQLAVESRLKLPSSAEFSPSSETTVEEVADNTYVVRGWVEAKNSFGGTVRNNCEYGFVELCHSYGTKVWICVNNNFDTSFF